MSRPYFSWMIAVIAFSLAWIGTGLVRRLILYRASNSSLRSSSSSLLDIPNHRSSHKAPTPRGGGVAFVLAFMVAGLCLTWAGAISVMAAIALLGSASMVALLGFLDDCGFGLSARHRLLIHFTSAAFFLTLIGGVPPVPAFGMEFHLGLAGDVLAAIYLVWMVNLFNFMDGIDGIAAVEAITVSLGGAFVWFVATGSYQWGVPVAFAAAVMGFLWWNHPPAKIFMGDAGSCFIGMCLGAMALWAGLESPQLFWSWSILLGCFTVDATVTLMRRLLRGKRFDEAHRSHAYQYASRKYGSHKSVTYVYGLINVVWLLPIAALVGLRRMDGAIGLLVAYVPLLLLAVKFHAGAPELQERGSASGVQHKEAAGTRNRPLTAESSDVT